MQLACGSHGVDGSTLGAVAIMRLWAAGGPPDSHGGHTHFTTISSRKLKKEISDYNIDLDKLFLLQPKRFKYRNQARDASKNREWDYGYIAEEAQDLGVEEILGYDENGEVDSINYSILSVFVLELVKKQQSEINLLSEEIKRLKENK